MRSRVGEAEEQQKLDALVEDARERLKAAQRPDGHWVFELEADTTIPSEYIFLQHYLDEVDPEEERKIANYIRDKQGADGGWPLFAQGEMDISASVKAYFALKLVGDDPESPHMRRAREAILAQGGAARANVFTRISLALFGQVPWRAVPVMPVEIMLLPRWFPFHLLKVSYWSRTVIVPLLLLMALKPQARNPRGVDIRELFATPPEAERDYIHNPTGKRLGDVFVWIDHVLQATEPYFPRRLRRKAMDEAMSFMQPRLNGEDGLGGIFPAMANAVMAMDALGYPPDHPDLEVAKRAIRNLVIVNDEEDKAYCQPCMSPIWDTVLAMHAVAEAGEPIDGDSLRRACDWLLEREITDVKGDWAASRPHLQPSGWAFQYRNDYYPDVDDTAVAVMALHRVDPEAYRAAIDRAADWIIGMQSDDGGWGAFDANNTYYYLNNIPFADHGALLDPPTVDVTARCLGMLVQLGYDRDHPSVEKAVDYLKREQESDGSWYGRWGVNYVYGTWSALCALNAVGEDMQAPYIRKAVEWLKARQLDDGGWGEDCATYWQHRRDEVKASTPSQTAWALLGLMAAGEVETGAVRRGIEHLKEQPRRGCNWVEHLWTGTGFPRVFYLKYHGYSAQFPLWATARYRNLMRGNRRRVELGM